MYLLTSGVEKLINGSTEKQTVSSGQKLTLKKRVLIRVGSNRQSWWGQRTHWTVSLLHHKAYLRLSTM